MIELERHITKLLLTNDCVIVPDFGGFMTHHIDSTYDNEAKMFYPPLRTLGFNPLLKINDSLLVQSYVEVYDISYPEALTRIENDVTLLKTELEKNSYYELYGLGEIRIHEDGKYEFNPCEAGILTPEYYGLSTFAANILSLVKPAAKAIEKDINAEKEIHSNKVETTHTDETKEEIQNNEDEKTISFSIRVSSLKEFAAACAILILFLLFPSPAGENSTSGINISQIDTNMLLNIMPKEMILNKPENIKFTNKTDNNKEVAPAKTETKKSATDNAVTPYYSIVLASRVSKKNAEAYVKALHEKGFDKARVYTKGKYSRVIYDKFATKDKAYEVLRKLNNDINFSDAWVTSITE